MREQKTASAFKACFYRERRRYFASSVYVMNTAIGYIMAAVLSAMLAFGEAKILFEQLPSSLTAKLAPLLLALLCNMSPTTTSAFSMEGKHFWLTQTLPVKVKNVVDAKLAVNFMLALPCVLISSALLFFAIRPTGADILWLFLVPAVYAVFGSVLGLFANMKMPMLHWDHESQPVKQGKATLVVMMVDFMASAAPVLPLIILQGIAAHILMLAWVAVLVLLSFWMYRRLCALRLTALAED